MKSKHFIHHAPHIKSDKRSSWHMLHEIFLVISIYNRLCFRFSSLYKAISQNLVHLLIY